MGRLHEDWYLPEYEDGPACVGLFHVTHGLWEKGVDVYELREQDARLDFVLTFVRAGLRLQSTRIVAAGLDALRKAGENYLHNAVDNDNPGTEPDLL
jgi:hypothetical protein